ncbi:hypothetical protein A2U01_0114684, partial [Trifolium medium]|nr:hypothetical protein [Trifolium medium]
AWSPSEHASELLACRSLSVAPTRDFRMSGCWLSLDLAQRASQDMIFLF